MSVEAPNGSASGSEARGVEDLGTDEERPRPSRKPLLVLFAITIFGAAVIVYGVTRPPSDEPIGASARDQIAAACLDAYHQLKAIPQLTGSSSLGDRAARVDAENVIMAAMLGRFDAQHPANRDGAVALRAWTNDWRELLTRRAAYADELRAGNTRAKPSFPIDDGAPVTKRMNGYALTNSVTICQTQNLQAEVVDGGRNYPRSPGGI